jgi:erythromycin esterase
MRMSLFFSWQTQEYRDMLEWMRAYNTDATHTTKIHFIGMDCQGVSQGDFDEVENYVHAVDPQQAAHIQNLYADIIARGIAGRYTIYPQLSAETKQQYQDQAQQVYDLLHAHQQAYENRSSPQAFALALQNARIIVQFAMYANQNSRDESLAGYIQRDAFHGRKRGLDSRSCGRKSSQDDRVGA